MFSRKTVNRIRYVLEDLIPPVLRDSRLFYFLMFFVYGKKTPSYTSFRTRSPYMSSAEYDEFYRSYPVMHENTDLNASCMRKILQETAGGKVIDVGCGRAYFTGLLAEEKSRRVVGVDLQVDRTLKVRYPSVAFVEAAIEKLPFRDEEFDTVICAHTLEHIVDFGIAVKELRRICRKRLIVIVPREREYRYSFNFHLHFFPYTHSLLNRLQPLPARHSCASVDGDLMYVEDRDEKRG